MLFLCFRRVNTKSSNHQSSSSSSSSSLSSCSSSSALAHELVQATVTETDTSSQLDWTYDPNEPRYCICNQVHFPQPSKIQSTNDSVSSPFPLLCSACMCLQSHTLVPKWYNEYEIHKTYYHEKKSFCNPQLNFWLKQI